MTTDITELAQSLKAAAEKANPGPWRRASTLFNGIARGKFSLTKEDIIAGTNEKRDAEFIALANPANILALVEALEKAQQQINELEQEHCGGALMERELAHSEVIKKLMSEIDNRDSRIAELESRTVTVKLPEPCVGVVQGGHAVMVPYAAGHWFNKTAILEMLNAEGIKWEAE
ncbi:TPA: ead/Ea22-like family protein [Klebsiella aerogenes]|nr:ead/Ea22-like family protein [Klebsiella aerogenes]